MPTPTVEHLPTLQPISATSMRSVEYLIEPFLPLGKFTDVAGQMGQGKSLLTVRWAADVSAGTGCAPASVVMYAVEDDDEDTTLPRLVAAGADTDRVYVRHDETLDGLADYCHELGDVRLVTVDPLTGFLPRGVDAFNTPQVRRFLRPVIELAREQRFAFVGVQHVNRGNGGHALQRIADAQGFPQVARAVLIWGPAPEDADECGSRKVLASAKLNLSTDSSPTAHARPRQSRKSRPRRGSAPTSSARRT